MKLLTAINRCTKHAGDGTTNDQQSTDTHASAARSTIAEVLRELSARGFAFNTNRITLTVNSAGRVPVSKSYLQVRLPSHLSIRHDSDDNRFVWEIAENDWYGSELSDVEVVFLEDGFENLEELVAQWIAWEATARYWFERRQTDPPATIERQRARAEANAMNSMRLTSLDQATGWSALENIETRGSRVNIDYEWVAV